MNNNNSYDYQKATLSYITDQIKFADTKAGVAAGVTLALLAFFGKKIKENGFNCINISGVGLIIGAIILVVTLYFLFWMVLLPRYSVDKSYCMSWGGISAFDNEQDYYNHIKPILDDNENLVKNMASQNYDLSQVCTKKFRSLKLGFVFLTIGSIICVLAWILP